MAPLKQTKTQNSSLVYNLLRSSYQNHESLRINKEESRSTSYILSRYLGYWKLFTEIVNYQVNYWELSSVHYWEVSDKLLRTSIFLTTKNSSQKILFFLTSRYLKIRQYYVVSIWNEPMRERSFQAYMNSWPPSTQIEYITNNIRTASCQEKTREDREQHLQGVA